MSAEKFEVCVCTGCKARQAARAVNGAPKVSGWGHRRDTRDGSSSGLMCPACLKKTPPEPHHLDVVFKDTGWVAYGQIPGTNVRAALSALPVVPVTAFGPHETSSGTQAELDLEQAVGLIAQAEAWILAADRSLEDLGAWIRFSTEIVLGPTSLIRKDDKQRVPDGLSIAARLSGPNDTDLGVVLMPTLLPPVDSDRVREVALWLVGVARGRVDARRYERSGVPGDEALSALASEESWILSPTRSAQELAGWVKTSLWSIMGLTSRWAAKGVNGVQEENGAIDIPDELSPFVDDADHLRHLALWIIGTGRGFAEAGVPVIQAPQPQPQPQT